MNCVEFNEKSVAAVREWVRPPAAVSIVDERALLRNAPHGSEEWLKYRANVAIVTASEVAACVGLSPCATPKKMFELRRGLVPRDDLSKNHHVQRGLRLEAPIRRLLQRILHLHESTRDWLVLGETGLYSKDVYGATPDGFVTPDRGRSLFPLEIKSRSSADPVDAPPLRYLIQLACHIVCTGARGGFYFSVTNDGAARAFFLTRNAAFDSFWREHIDDAAHKFIHTMKDVKGAPTWPHGRNMGAKKRRDAASAAVGGFCTTLFIYDGPRLVFDRFDDAVLFTL